MNSEQFIIRTQSDIAYTYGVGEKQAENVYLFRAGESHLTLSEAQSLLARKLKPQKAAK